MWLLVCFWGKIHAQNEQGVGTRPEGENLKEKKDKKDDFPERRFLSLEKNGAVKRIRFYENQNITFLLKNDDKIYNTLIQKVNKDNVMLMDVHIPLEEFDKIRVEYNRFYPRLFEFAFWVGGIGYFGLDMANNEFRMNNRSWQVPAGLLLSALAIKVIYPRKRIYKLNHQKYLKTIGY